MLQEIKRKTRKQILAGSAFTILIAIAMMGGPALGARGDVRGAPDPPVNALTTKILDGMRVLPGDLAPLPPLGMSNTEEQAQIELGKMLFFDKRLSRDRSMSCATCHDPAKGFGDGRALAVGFGGKVLARHSPTILNSAYNSSQFWDGRAASLEEQAVGPIMAAAEMNMVSEQEVVARLSLATAYAERFRAAFGEGPNLKNIARAIASFERTLVTPDSRFDRYLAGDKSALTEPEKRGLILFIGKASCSECHNGSNLADNKFHVLGRTANEAEDVGRYAVSKDEKDRGAFKTPTLRNVELTAPYTHNGVFKSLDEVIEFYSEGGGEATNKSDLILKLELTRQEQADLVAFLKSLTGRQPQVEVPQLPGDN
jgi:cytochrome c peroxidase